MAAGLLDCPGCHRLVYGRELTRLAAEARAAEDAGDLTTALGTWRRAIELLPGGTAQRTAIDVTMRRLSATIDGRIAGVREGGPGGGGAATGAGGKAPGTGKKARALAGTSAFGAAVLKSKALLAMALANGKFLLLGLLKLPTLLSMAWYASMTGGRGLGLSIGIVAAIYIHEVGHVATLRRYGIDASAPMFVPGFGAFVRLRQYPTDAHEEARTGLAGPLWGLFAAAAALTVGAVTGSKTALQVASWSASINVFNLVPVWQLDGARGLKALSKVERLAVGVVALVVGALVRQWMPAIVGILVLSRTLAFTGAPHAEGDRKVLTLFVLLVTLHPAVAWVADALRQGLPA